MVELSAEYITNNEKQVRELSDHFTKISVQMAEELAKSLENASSKTSEPLKIHVAEPA